MTTESEHDLIHTPPRLSSCRHGAGQRAHARRGGPGQRQGGEVGSWSPSTRRSYASLTLPEAIDDGLVHCRKFVDCEMGYPFPYSVPC